VRAAAFPLGAAVTLAQLDADPHPVLARLREHEPVSWLPALGGWLLTRRDLALAVMRDPETFTVEDPRFSTGRVIGPSMLTLEGAEHKRHREPFARPFRLDAVRERFTAPVQAETDRLIDAIAPAGAGELRRELAGPLATAAVTHALGLARAGTAEVLAWYDAIVASVTEITAGRPPTEAGRRGFEDLRAAIEPVLARGPGRSLVAAAAAGGGDGGPGSDEVGSRAAAGGGGLRRDEVVSNAAVLLFGGIETTEGMIANALAHLLGHRDQLAAVRSEPELLANAIEESLRLEPAAAVIDRYATRAVELGGAAIGERELVVVSIAGANRDPATFDDPDRFDVRRSNAKLHAAFAAGPHVCVGMHLARLEAQTAVARVLERLPDLRLEDGHAPAARGLVFRKPDALRVRWTPRAAVG